MRTYSVTAEWLERDGDLASLRGEEGFREVVAELRAREAALEGPGEGR